MNLKPKHPMTCFRGSFRIRGRFRKIISVEVFVGAFAEVAPIGAFVQVASMDAFVEEFVGFISLGGFGEGSVEDFVRESFRESFLTGSIHSWKLLS